MPSNDRNRPGYRFEQADSSDYGINDRCIPKAKALADYAAKDSFLARVEMIREMKGAVPGQKIYKRLDMAKTSVRAKVLGIHAPEELDQVFAEAKE